MAQNNKAQHAFCLHPENISNQDDIFSVLEIIKNKNNLSRFENYTLDENILKYLRFTKTEQATFDLFTKEHHHFRKNEIIKFFKKQKSGGNLENYLPKAYNRELYDNLKLVIEYGKENKLYQRILNPKTGNYLISSCSISDIKPTLEINLYKRTKDKFTFSININIDNNTFPIDDVECYEFLIKKENTYYLLKIDDYYNLIWLYKELNQNNTFDEQYLLKNIVKKIEHLYKINGKEIFSKNLIDVAPKNCIYFSEVNSGAFLMLTPQFRYDNILIDGTYAPEHETSIDGKIYTIKRNETLENDFISYIKSKHPNFSKQLNNYYYLSFDEAKKKNWFLKLYHELLEENVELIGMDMLGNFRYSKHSIQTKFEELKTIENIIEAKMQVSFGDEIISLSELQKTLFNHQRNILLKDNSIGIITEEWITNYELIIKHSKIEKNKIIIPKWLLLQHEEIKQLAELKFIIKDDWREKWNLWQQIETTVYPVPNSIKATLRPYQQKGYEWLCLLAEINAGACLADDMGLGKTIQTICFIANQLEKNTLEKFIIVCPSSLMYNWKNELEKFLPSANAFLYYQQNRDFTSFLESGANIMIVPYSTLRADIEKIKNTLWNTIILDESHNIKTYYAQTTKAVYQIIAKHKIALSGTPIMNNTFDLYAQLNYLLPEYLGSQEFFRQEYVLPIDRDKNEEKTIALQKITAPFILRRTKQQVATDLPEKTELVLWCDMHDEQQEVYNTIKAQIRKSIFLNIQNDGLAKSKLNILQGIIKLRQVCCSPTLLKQDDIGTTSSIKIDMLLDEIINNLSKNKVLVFSQFKGMLHLIAEKLIENNIPYFHFDGDTAVEDRQKMVAAFQEDDSTERVFLMSLKTGNAGINLTAADYVFLVDPWWNTAIQQQAIDRTHRIGQTKNVFAYKMICKNSIEEKIISIQERKQVTSDALIVAEENFVKNLTQEDIAYLFE
jgi:SNF2 family DNA or RNA helicase